MCLESFLGDGYFCAETILQGVISIDISNNKIT